MIYSISQGDSLKSPTKQSHGPIFHGYQPTKSNGRSTESNGGPDVAAFFLNP